MSLLLANRALLKSEFPSSGLIAYYPFNGNANDESGNGNNGTVNGAVLTTGRKGDANGAYEFTKGEDDYIDISSIGNVDPFSVSIWAYCYSDDNMGLIAKGLSSTAGDWNIKKVQNVYRTGANSDATKNLDVAFPGFNRWDHIVYMYDGSTLYLYFNGSFIDSDILVSLNNNYSTVYIGQQYNSSFSFNGRLDDIRIYNRKLTDSEILALYNE